MGNEMTRLLIKNARLFGPTDVWESGWLLTEGKTIQWMGPGIAPEYEPGWVTETIDAQGKMLLPGFIDLHAHGAMGHEVMDASVDGLKEMARFYARHGVTAFLPTTWTASHEQIRAALACVAQIAGRIEGGATIVGVHLEGPFINAKKSGAQDTALIRRSTPEEVLEYLDTGLVKLIALAPEYPENLWLVDECTRRGIAVSAAHTESGLEELQTAVSHGLRHVTHCFNAMRPLGHRDLGTVGAAMALPELNTELIADNIHVHPAAQRILIEVKKPARVILVTDSIRGTGMPDGDYPIDSRIMRIRNGEVRLEDGTLAGSVLTMERALRNAYHNSGRPLQEVWPMSSLNAAREIGISAHKGSLEAGKDADLVLLDDDFEVCLTVAEGDTVFAREGSLVKG